MIKSFFVFLKKILLTALKGFSEHSLMTYAASIAFYTIFSLPGLLITMIVTAGFFLGKDAVQGELVSELQDLIGLSSAEMVEQIIVKIQLSGGFTLKTIVGIATLLFSATTIFISLQEALNRIWEVNGTPRKGFIKFIINRVLSFGMIISLGLILLISLLLNTILTLFFDKIENTIGHTPSLWLNLTSILFSLSIIFLVVAIIFKILPDVKLKIRDVTIGSAITACLLLFGNYLIGLYISTSNFSETYDAAGSIIIILVWVYYSTVVILFGAELTHAIMLHRGKAILPKENAQILLPQKVEE